MVDASENKGSKVSGAVNVQKYRRFHHVTSQLLVLNNTRRSSDENSIEIRGRIIEVISVRLRIHHEQ